MWPLLSLFPLVVAEWLLQTWSVAFPLFCKFPTLPPEFLPSPAAGPSSLLWCPDHHTCLDLLWLLLGTEGYYAWLFTEPVKTSWIIQEHKSNKRLEAVDLWRKIVKLGNLWPAQNSSMVGGGKARAQVWRAGDTVGESKGGSGAGERVRVLDLSTQTTSFVGSCLCTGQIGK